MTFGIIAGTGALDLFERGEERRVESAWGEPSTNPCRVRVGGQDGWFLARHGRPHRIPPHRVNYRANIDVLRQLGVRRIVGVTAVGGLVDTLSAGSLVVPDQLIDYTWGRAHTFSDDAEHPLQHVEFGKPFSEPLRRALLEAGAAAGLDVVDGGCYAVTQGPRLETEAEVVRLARDGGTLVGMTAMPEAGLAREAGIDYANLSVVANPAAGLSAEPISTEDIEAVMAQAVKSVAALLERL
jgi:5'-deoxy-5'-methylthioadenosine phosphorylase